MKTLLTIFIVCITGFWATSSVGNDAFFSNLSRLCGQTFVGEMTFPTEGQDSFRGKRLLATVAQCSDTTISIPFQVGSDQSRTWVISKTKQGLLLKHDHRHNDGTADEITNYGGYAESQGTALSQAFAADEFTQNLIPEAATNVWAITLSADGETLRYHLERHQKARFTAVLTNAPIPAP